MGSTTLDRKCIYANPSSNPKAQLCFRTDEMTSFFDQVYRYRFNGLVFIVLFRDWSLVNVF